MWRWWLVMIIALVGCEAKATPVALVAPPTITPIPSPTPNNALRYGLLANMGLFPHQDNFFSLADNLSINQNVLEEAQDQDILIGYGTADEWGIAPVSLELRVMVNERMAINDSAAQDALLSALRSLNLSPALQALNINGTTTPAYAPVPSLESRLELAQAGNIDGINITIAHTPLPLPLLIEVQNIFASHNIEVSLLPIGINQIDSVQTSQKAHMVIFSAWSLPSAQSEQVIASIPLRYRVFGELAITFTNEGFPLLKRP